MASVPLPDWVEEVRPHQTTAVKEIMEAFLYNDVVMLDAPTGSGKTLIAELVRRELERKCLYVASDNSLTDQFARDFPYAKALKGRANYPTENSPEHTADDCTSKGPGDPCWWCDEYYTCPYQVAKQAAIRAPLAVTNTAMLLTEANYVGGLSRQQFIVADEADTLESMLMGFVEYAIGERRIKEFDMTLPGKGVHKKTLVSWLGEFDSKIVEQSHSETDAKKVRRLAQLHGETQRIMAELQREIDKSQTSETEGKWLRLYDDRNKGLHLKPVMVDSYGTRRLWRHSKKWLLMSATIISADEIANSLGLPLDYTTVLVPSTFPIENRPVIMAPVANVVYKEMEQAIPKLITAIAAVLAKHPHDRILIHTVSYNLARDLTSGLRNHPNRGPRKLLTYTEGRDRERILAEYKKTPGSVMFAPSMGRGIDLPGDLCRVQVIAKVPYLSLGDAQVSRRTHLPGGDLWFKVQAIRDIVQMCGRGIRSKEDWAITYIFDAQFATNLWRKNKGLFPQWFRDAVVTNTNIREFLV